MSTAKPVSSGTSAAQNKASTPTRATKATKATKAQTAVAPKADLPTAVVSKALASKAAVKPKAVKPPSLRKTDIATKSVAITVDGMRATGQNDLESMIQGMLKETKLATSASTSPSTPVEGQRCGLIAIVGKPNVGKSTLLNALVGQKISITSRKAQTTRHRITGMHTQGATQFVFVDTPGFQTRHNNALNRALNKTVKGAVGDVDLILFVVEAGMFNQADAKVLALLGKDIPTLLVANKLDQVTRRADIAPWLQEMQKKGEEGGGGHAFAEFVPMSAKNAKDIERLLIICEKYLPEQPWRYAEDELTDRSEKFLASETVREKLFRLTGTEQCLCHDSGSSTMSDQVLRDAQSGNSMRAWVTRFSCTDPQVKGRITVWSRRRASSVVTQRSQQFSARRSPGDPRAPDSIDRRLPRHDLACRVPAGHRATPYRPAPAPPPPPRPGRRRGSPPDRRARAPGPWLVPTSESPRPAPDRAPRR